MTLKIIVHSMGFDIEKSFIMAERLKLLREGKGLSHERLSKALLDQYGVRISSDSLINYEVADAGHTKAYKNQGMRVEYLRCLADFYGVSADYILGSNVPRSADFKVRQMVEFSGLAEENVIMLRCARAILENTDDYQREQKEQQLMTAFEFLKDGMCPRQVGAMVIRLVNDLTAAVFSDEGIIIDFATLLSASETPNTFPVSYDPEFYKKLVGNGLVALPADEYVRYISHQIGRSVGDALIARYEHGND